MLCRWPLLLTLCAAVETGCANLYVQQADGQIKVERYMGVVSVELSPATQAQVAETKAFGVIKAPQGLTIGYQNASLLAMPPSCRLVLWVTTDKQLYLLDELLQGHTDVCVGNQHLKEIH